MITAKDLGQIERLDGLRGDWHLIGILGGPAPDELAIMSPRIYDGWEFKLRKELAFRPDTIVHDDGSIEMILAGDEDNEPDEWRLRARKMRDSDEAARYGRGSQYRASRHLICLLAGDRMPEDVDRLSAGAYLGLLEAIGAGF